MTIHAKGELTCIHCGVTFIGTLRPPTRTCPARKCRYRTRGRKHCTYQWTPERDDVLRRRYDGKVKHRAAAIARIWGWPPWVVKKRAASLGLTYPADRRDFTPEEVAFIEEWTGLRDSIYIARRLHRSLTSVVLKQKRMGLSRRVRDGYTMTELQQCFGVDHHSIDRWIREGKLQGKRRVTARLPQQGGHPWAFDDDDLVRFIRTYPNAFRLDKVDQVWFMDLVVGGGLLREKAS